jgi:predicted methyltransferase
MIRLATIGLLAASLAISAASCSDAAAPDPLRSAIDAPTRTDANRQRDVYRHPYETLAFFGIEPDDTVVEIWPGGGWYTEVLAPYLASGGGKYILAAPESSRKGTDKLKAANATLYGPLTYADFPVFDGKAPEIAAESVDLVLTFRNVHNWRMGAMRDDKADYAPDAFRQIFAMLKPGGVLGVVDHRLPEDANPARERNSGYMKTSTIIGLAKQAGFELAGSSEINANPKDTTDHPEGVWTLPPSYALEDKDRAKYAAIGESDRMTLKFVKPRSAR